MELEIKRTDKNERRTIGRVYIDGRWLCYSLEDAVRKEKIPGKTAIPAGRYKVTVSYSPKFKRLLPLLHNVPGFEGVRIHSGNKASDTEGCILLGLYRNEDMVLDSRLAFDEFMRRIQDVYEEGEDIWLQIG